MKKAKQVASHQVLVTFESIALDWHSTKSKDIWSDRHSNYVLLKIQKYILPSEGVMALQEITTQHCIAVLREIEKRGSPEQGKRTLGVKRGFCSSQTFIKKCPSATKPYFF